MSLEGEAQKFVQRGGEMPTGTAKDILAEIQAIPDGKAASRIEEYNKQADQNSYITHAHFKKEGDKEIIEFDAPMGLVFKNEKSMFGLGRKEWTEDKMAEMLNAGKWVTGQIQKNHEEEAKKKTL